MPNLLEELEEIIEYAKGDFFPASHLLRNALVVAKRIDDREFEEFIIKESKGYERGTLPEHRKLQGSVMVAPPYGGYQEVEVDDLDANSLRKVSTAYVVEPVSVLEKALNFEGEDGYFTAEFSPENEGVLHPLQNKQVRYVIVIDNSRVKGLLDDVRTIVLDWAIKQQREIIAASESRTAAVEPQSTNKAKRSFVQYVRDNKQWIFSGLGVTILVTAITVVKDFLSKNDKPDERSNVPTQTITPTPTPSLTPTPTATPSPVPSLTPRNPPRRLRQ
jgi:AbiTii